MRKTVIVFSMLAILLLAGIAATQDNGEGKKTALAGTIGLAARYPGDQGIGNDPAVVFSENFESITVTDLSQRWTHVNNSNGSVLFIVKDTTAPSIGKYCLRMTGTKGQNVGGHLWQLLDEGQEQLYARFYCKFAPDAPYVHHFIHLGGTASTNEYPSGGAGNRPTGESSFSTSMDLVSRATTDPPGAWSFYSYWSEMHSWQTPEGVPDGVQSNPYYGNLFGPLEPLQARRDEWQCVEIMIKLNDPGERNGEEAFWVDGKLVERYGPGTIEGTWFRDMFRRTGIFNTDPKPFEGFLWSTSENLKINTFWLQYYLAHVFENDYNPHDPEIPYNDNKGIVYFDNVVLATEYIGPVVSAQKPAGDYDGDGQAGISDVIRLIKLCMEEYPDQSADYNRDGAVNVADALALLLDIMTGKAGS